MDEPPSYLLENLASIEEQRRHVVGATVDEYLIPEEILNDAWHFCERAQHMETLAKLNTEQREAVERLKDALGRLGGCTELYDRTNIADLVERDNCWAMMRDLARNALQVFS
jgi:hypothetical protein